MHHYNKLIRDNIPDIKSRQGKKVAFHAAENNEDYWRKLLEKMQASIDEFSRRLDLESLADVFEVLDAIMDFKMIDRKELHAVKENKKIEKGGFKNRYILDSSEDEIGASQEQSI